MINKEKYPKTEDAMKAFEEWKKSHPISCASYGITFDGWLDLDLDEKPNCKEMPDIAKALATVAIGAMAMSAVSRMCGGDKPKDEPGEDEPREKKDEPKPSFCPFCGGKVAVKSSPFMHDLTCESCGMSFSHFDHMHDLPVLVKLFNRRADKPAE